MKDLTLIPKQTEPKSVLDMTPFELSQINQFQNDNRGFTSEDEDELEGYYDN